MIKNILKLSGVEELKKSQQKNVRGGNGDDVVMGYCYDPNTWWYEHPCGQVCNDGVSYPEYC